MNMRVWSGQPAANSEAVGQFIPASSSEAVGQLIEEAAE